MEGPERAELIAGRLTEVLGDRLTGSPRRLSSGASRETWIFGATAHGDLVAQLDGGGRAVIDRPPQAPLLRAAADAGVPVPAVIASGADDPVLGSSWMVVEAIPGTTDPATILAAEGSDPARLVESIAAALAGVHRIPVDGGLAPAVDDPVAMLRQLHDGLGEAHPVFELAFRKLGRTRPRSTRRGLVHGDYRLGNLMVDCHAVSGVLDWELAHVGDPAEDLGWLCVRAWRFGRPDRAAAGLGSREQLLAAYERHSGVAVDPAELSWWEVFGALRWGVITVMQADAHLSGAIRSVEHAVIGRRSCEVEWDLLDLLAPDTKGRVHSRPARRARSPPPTTARPPRSCSTPRAAPWAMTSSRELERAARVSGAGLDARARDRQARARPGRRARPASAARRLPASASAAKRSSPRASARATSPSASKSSSQRCGRSSARSLRSPTRDTSRRRNEGTGRRRASRRDLGPAHRDRRVHRDGDQARSRRRATTRASSTTGASTARTDFEAGGIPSRDWEDLLEEAMARADRAGLWRYPLPAELGGRDGTNLGMAVVREHLARRGIGLHNDPQSEISHRSATSRP